MPIRFRLDQTEAADDRPSLPRPVQIQDVLVPIRQEWESMIAYVRGKDVQPEDLADKFQEVACALLRGASRLTGV